MFKVFAATLLLLLLNSSNFSTNTKINHPTNKQESVVSMKDFSRAKRCFVWLPKEDIDVVKKALTAPAR